MIVRTGSNIDKIMLLKSKKIIDKILLEIAQLDDLSDVTLKEVLEMCNISESKYYTAFKHVQKKNLTIIYKRRPCEVNIGPYNTVLLMLLKSNMNIQFVSGIYAMLMYLTSYLCKPEHTMSELMKKASKEAYDKDLKGKLYAIGNVFLTKREVSTHEAIKRVLSLPMRRSNIDVLYVPTGLKKNRTRMLKAQNLLEMMHPDDTNIYAANILDKYENRPESLEEMCLADFASNYTYKKNDQNKDPEAIESYSIPVHNDDLKSSSDEEDYENDDKNKRKKINDNIVLKNDFGEMRKRERPCVIRFHKVTKMTNSEVYFLRLLQLYMPWRNEDELKGDYETYEDKYNEIESSIKPNLEKHEPYLDIDYDDLDNPYLSESDSDDEGNDEFSMINPDLIDFEIDQSNITNNVPIAATTRDYIMLPAELFHEMCSKLNDEQQYLFNYVMRYAINCRFSERNDVEPPDSFYIFLSGGAGVGKSFLVKAITEYLKRILRYPKQNLDEPSVLVTASTGKAATQINGTTLHSAFHLPIRNNTLRKSKKRGPSDEHLHEMRNRYKFLKVLLIDEISMIGDKTWEDLHIYLTHIMNNNLLFGGISIIGIGDFLQLPPVNAKTVYSAILQGYKVFNKPLWHNFVLHELVQIVRQSSDPEFAQLLNRLREGKHTATDVKEIQMLADVDTTLWPNEYVKLYMTNYMAGRENDECIAKLNAETIVINAEDSKRDSETRTCTVSIPDNCSLTNTANLTGKLKICVGARIMLLDNIDIPGKLINGSMGTVARIHINRRKPLLGKIYVKFDDPQAGNSMKETRLRGELKECVPITAVTKAFPFKRGNSTVTVQRKQYPVILGHAITIHKSQGSTLKYMKGDLDRSTGKGRGCPVAPGLFYTLLSRAQSRDKVQLLNFTPDMIKVNEAAIIEMERMRSNCVFSWNHPLQNIIGKCFITLLNIVSWNAHIEHFLSDKMYANHSALFCFTETNIAGRSFQNIETYEEGWADIHNTTGHGLAICYNTSKVKIIQKFETSKTLEILPVLMDIENETILVLLLYRPPGSVGTFITDLMSQVSELPTQYRILILGDFNLDQMLPENVKKINPIISQFHLHQRSQYTTHIEGGILDLVLDSTSSQSVEWMPSPFSDHFSIITQL